jgi:hypothetical protein
MDIKSWAWVCCVVLLANTSSAAADSGYQDWLEMKKTFADYAAGPTGYYAIQDMKELKPGDSISLNASAHIQYKDNKAILSGAGISPTDLLQLENRQLQLPSGLIVRVSPLHETALKAWLYDPKLPARRHFKSLTYFDYDPRGVLQGKFTRFATPAAQSYLDSRDEEGTMYVMGTLQLQIDGKPYELKTYSYKQNWADIEALLILLKDRTSGKTTYGGGRVVEVNFPKGAPPATMTVNLNTAYSFLCAHSNFYNCPLVLASTVDSELRYGEKYPPLFTTDTH